MNDSTTLGTLLDGTESKIFVDSDASKSFISKQYYLRNKSLIGLPKFSSKAKLIQVGKGGSVKILFIAPIIIAILGNMFEFYMMVPEINDNVDLMLGVKNFV